MKNEKAREKICVSTTSYWGPHWRGSFWGVLKPVSYISDIFEFCRATLVVFYFWSEAIIGFSFN